MSLFRASNSLCLDLDSELKEVTFDTSLESLLISGWSWQDLDHFCSQRVLHFRDRAVVLRSAYIHELLQASARVRGLYCFEWTEIATDVSRELMLFHQTDEFDVEGNELAIAETFSGLMAMFAISSVPLDLTIRSLVFESSPANFPLLPFDEALLERRPLRLHEGLLRSNLRRVAFHNMPFESQGHRSLIEYLQGIDQLDLDSIFLDLNNWTDFIRQLKQLQSLRVLRVLHSYRPPRHETQSNARLRSLSLLDLVANSDSRLEVVSICRQHRAKKYHHNIERHLKFNLLRNWRARFLALADTYSADGYTPPLTVALARVSHSVDLTFAMITANARALCYCRPPSHEETMQANRKELESLMARLYGHRSESQSLNGGFGCDQSDRKNCVGNECLILAPQSSIESTDLLYSIARDILAEE